MSSSADTSRSWNPTTARIDSKFQIPRITMCPGLISPTRNWNSTIGITWITSWFPGEMTIMAKWRWVQRPISEQYFCDHSCMNFPPTGRCWSTGVPDSSSCRATVLPPRKSLTEQTGTYWFKSCPRFLLLIMEAIWLLLGVIFMRICLWASNNSLSMDSYDSSKQPTRSVDPSKTVPQR